MNHTTTDAASDSSRPTATPKSLITPVMLIAVGLTILANNFIPEFHLSQWWPVVVIALGSGCLLNRLGNWTRR